MDLEMGDSADLFSRLGRAGTQRFGLIKRTEQLLNGKSQTERKALDVPKHLSTREELLLLNTQEPALQPCSPNHSFPFCLQSRESFYKAQVHLPEAPPPGTYDVSYDQVDK